MNRYALDLTSRTDYNGDTERIIVSETTFKETSEPELSQNQNQNNFLKKSEFLTSSVKKFSDIDYKYLERGNRIRGFLTKHSNICPNLEENGFDIKVFDEEKKLNNKMLSLGKNLLFLSKAVKDAVRSLSYGSMKGAKLAISEERIAGASKAVQRLKEEIGC